MRPVITFLTDFGPAAPAVCRGVMFRICPDANIIDITHQVPRYSIREGAGSLVFALPHMPVGIHVAVVDPGVGTERLAVGLRAARGDVLIGPDNGLLIAAAEALGGIVEARALENRDADAAGHLVQLPRPRHLLADRRAPRERRGLRVGRADRADAEQLVRLPEIRPTVRDGVLETTIVHVADLRQRHARRRARRPRGRDRAARAGQPAADRVPGARRRHGTSRVDRLGADLRRVPVGSSLLMADSEGHLSLADNQGDAADRLGLVLDRPARIARRPDATQAPEA